MKLAFMSFSMMREAFLGKMDADTLCAVAAERLLNEGVLDRGIIFLPSIARIQLATQRILSLQPARRREIMQSSFR